MRNSPTRMVLAAIAVLALAAGLAGQRAPAGADERETDPLVLQKLEWFQDQKFRLMMQQIVNP